MSMVAMPYQQDPSAPSRWRDFYFRYMPVGFFSRRFPLTPTPKRVSASNCHVTAFARVRDSPIYECLKPPLKGP
jgi:hypothetical protein